jgi:hypothetical protein
MVPGEKIMMNRRHALKKIFGTIFATLFNGLLAREGRAQIGRASSPHKVDKKMALYQNHPDKGKMCMNCRHFIPPGGMSSMMNGMPDMGSMTDSMGMGKMMAGRCTIVAGPISPMGYCRFYQKKR